MARARDKEGKGQEEAQDGEQYPLKSFKNATVHGYGISSSTIHIIVTSFVECCLYARYRYIWTK
jgi:hypothetical protein